MEISPTTKLQTTNNAKNKKSQYPEDNKKIKTNKSGTQNFLITSEFERDNQNKENNPKS